MKKIFNLFDLSQKVNYKNELLSGLTVALALVPEAIAFAVIAGVPPLTGLYAAFTMGLITSILGGRPGMISGATGAVAVLLKPLVDTYGADLGLQYILAAVILAGIIQMLAGFFKLGKFIRLVPHPVIFGFVNGLAIIIFKAQFSQFKDPNTSEYLQGFDMYLMIGLALIAMAIIWLLPKITKAFPAPLAAILIVFGIVYFGGDSLQTISIGDQAPIKGTFPPFALPGVDFNFATLKIITPFAFMIAAVGLVESLLTLNIVDEITETRGNGNKEAVAQGAANFLTGFFGGMGGCAMIGQSLINISSGARARLSGIFAAIMLLIFIMYGSAIIEQIPVAALIGVMFMVAIGTFEWASLKTFTKMPKSDIFVMVIVTIITVWLDNLALAVIAGVIIAALVFAWDNAQRIRARKSVDENGIKNYQMYGPLFFGSVNAFSEKFDVLNDPDEVIIDFRESRIVDMSAIEAVNKITERYAKVGKKVHLKYLSPDCIQLLNKANTLIDVNVIEDPTYKVLVDDI